MAQDSVIREATIDPEFVEMEHAFTHYTALRAELELQSMGQFATVDVVDGRYAVAPSRFEASAAFRRLNGDRPAWTFHIGTS